MIKKHLLKVTLVTTVIATLLTATACGSSKTSDTTTAWNPCRRCTQLRIEFVQKNAEFVLRHDA